MNVRSKKLNGLVGQYWYDEASMTWKYVVYTDEQYALACKNKLFNLYASGERFDEDQCEAALDEAMEIEECV